MRPPFSRDYEVTERMMENADIPRGYWDAQIQAVSDTDLGRRMSLVLQDVSNMLKEGRGVLIAGSICTGKTTFSGILLREALHHGAMAQYVRAATMFSQWEAVAYKEQYGKTLRYKFLRAHFAVIDDLGTENPNDRTRALLENALRERLDEKKSTVLVTNMNFEDLQTVYSPAILSVIERVCPKQLIVTTDQWRREISEYR